MATETKNVVVDGETVLLFVSHDESEATNTYSEEYYRWRTGNDFTFPATLNANEVAEEYKRVRTP